MTLPPSSPPPDPAPAQPDVSPTPPSRGRRTGGVVVVLFLLVLAAACAIPFLVVGSIMGAGPLPEAKTVVIPRGTSIHEMGEMLTTNGVISHPLLFRLATRYMANDVMKAGEYQFGARMSVADAVLMIHEGRSVVRTFTLTEGTTSAEAIRVLRDMPTLTGDIAGMPPEGSLLPETYNYSYGDTRASIITRMQKGMTEVLDDLWAKRDPELMVKTPQEAVILASIVEKETGKTDERPRVAGVFANRLRANMRLQSDPTVIYALVQAHGTMDHELNHDDLLFPSPYNTYAIDGLPPGPICNPGRAALAAALHPEMNDYLYFVADGSGGHAFAHDLASHNQNVTHWNEVKPRGDGSIPLPPPVPAGKTP